jgi:hypothetical protein
MRAISLAAVAALTCALSWGDQAKAWGKFGHVTVCDLAYRNLTPTSRKEIGKILQSSSGGITVPGKNGTIARHYTSFNIGCLEEDELPRRHADDHFLNLPRDTQAVTGSDCPPAAPGGECILQGIRRDLDILKDPSRSNQDRAFALFAVGHWVGDIHQPLHISYADDRGGNGIDAKVTGGCGKFGYHADNLHGVWDNCILHVGTFGRVRQRSDYKPTWSRWTVTYRAVDTLLANTSLTEERQIVQGEPWQWANESYQIARDPRVHYCVLVAASCNYSSSVVKLSTHMPKRMEQLDQAYLQTFDRTVEDRIRYAGFRLADLLNKALDPGYSGPVRDGPQPA